MTSARQNYQFYCEKSAALQVVKMFQSIFTLNKSCEIT